ncbi:sigma-70 family RNA polymerase sigma factor [Cohnella nanjingensis]|uniref:Sigma-70 family RNA polymerase sigma factor n=1 Tax=Cohnella nanjingensis TaxID=1387779 RepID=A0A7X0RQ56_9BACL|nr:sigma-70 family RNA polymerase sigma factor [Cohnella nanjingensis]MBB6670234.1 sigma-70 family RNA polymerase sigma factor [Cohnella nanjingensis]
MNEHHWLAEQFEENRAHLQAVAYRMLGSLSEADDAVQESWFRLSRSDRSEIENICGWLTTVVSRVCLDMLRSRKARREESIEGYEADRVVGRTAGGDPEHEALLADSVGLALLVVLGKLNPVERITFVLHDIFAIPFTEIAPIVGRSEVAARQLASRARRRVQGAEAAPKADLGVQRTLVDAFLAAARTGNFEALLEVLDPEVVLRNDRAAVSPDPSSEIRGAQTVAKMLMFGRARAARPALVNGDVGIIVAPHGRLLLVLVLTYADGKIVAIDQVDDPARVEQLDLAVLSE